MVIQFQCPECQRRLGAGEQFAGKLMKCPGCAAVVPVPASPTEQIAEPANPFAFSTPATAPTEGTFEFDKSEPPADDPDGSLDATRAGWQDTATALKTVWWGTCVQLLSVSTLLVVVIALSAMGANTAALIELTDDPEAMAEARRASETAARRGMVLGLGAVGLCAIGGTVLRIAGFGHCLSVPRESGAWGLTPLLLIVEAVLVIGLLLTVLGGAVHQLVPRVGFFVTLAAVVIGLIFLLLFLRQIGVALHSRQLPATVVRFAAWLLGGLVGMAAAVGGQVLLVRRLSAGPPTQGKAWMVLICLLLMIAVCLGLSLTVMVKYLGLFNVARDEIRRHAKLRNT